MSSSNVIPPVRYKNHPVGYPSQISQIDVNELHLRDDVDSSWKAHHHTLGSNPGQASDGTHDHDGVNSASVLATYPYVFRASVSSLSVASGTYPTTAPIDLTTYSAGGINSSAADLVSGGFVVPFDGVWMLEAYADIAANATGFRMLAIYQGGSVMGSTRISMAPLSGQVTYLQSIRGTVATKGTVFKPGFIQNSGGALVVTFILQATCINRTAL